MSDSFTSDISDRICSHMNEDHQDAVLPLGEGRNADERRTAFRRVRLLGASS